MVVSAIGFAAGGIQRLRAGASFGTVNVVVVVLTLVFLLYDLSRWISRKYR